MSAIFGQALETLCLILTKLLYVITKYTATTATITQNISKLHLRFIKMTLLLSMPIAYNAA
jgi:hypothetical protein